MTVDIRMLNPGEEGAFARVAPEVFDYPPDRALSREFLADPHHHIAVAIDGGTIVAFASGVDYVHPDKPREMFVNEVGTAATHRGRGLGKTVVTTLLDHARAIGCTVAWVLTDLDNTAARALYRSAGGQELSHDTVHVEWTL